MNILFVGIGEDGLLNNVGGSLDRHLRYSALLGNCSMLLINRKTKLSTTSFGKFSINPINSKNIIVIIIKSLILIKKLNSNYKLDAISCQDPFLTSIIGILAKYLFNIPIHIQNHSCFIDNKIWIKERPIIFRILNFIGKINIKLADRLRVVNSREKNIYMIKLQIPEHKIDLAPVPIDSSFWESKTSESEKDEFIFIHKIEKNHIKLGWAGRFVRVKNLPYLFEAISKIQQSRFQLIMAGNNLETYYDLKKLEKKYSITPIYTGLLSKKELKSFYKSIDIYLHTSNYEGYGLVVADALSNGIPVVSTNVAGSNDLIIHGKTGFVANTISEFSNYVDLLITDEDLRKSFSRNAYFFARKHLNLEKMEKEVVNSIIKTIND